MKSEVKSVVLRFGVLFCACFITFGSYFVYDLPGALGNEVVESWFKVDTVKYELLYSVYSWPNTVLAFVGGFLVDHVFGARKGALIFCAIIVIGQTILSLGFHYKLFYLALVGRFIFGLVGESIAVVQNAFVCSWFFGKELALGLGIAVSFSRVGSAVNFSITPTLATSFSASIAVWCSLIACVISCIFAVTLFAIDLYGERNGFKPKLTSNNKKDVSENSNQKKKFDSCIAEFSVLLKFPLSIWILYAAIIAFYIGQFTFMTIGNNFLSSTFGISHESAGNYLTIPYTLSAFHFIFKIQTKIYNRAAVACPLFGILVDFSAHHLLWSFFFFYDFIFSVYSLLIIYAVLGASCLQLIDFVLMIYTTIPPAISMTLLGLSYTLFASSVWSVSDLLFPYFLPPDLITLKSLFPQCIPLLIPKDSHATAFGLAFSLQNLGLSISPLIVGRLVDISGDYISAVWFFSTCSEIAIGIIICLIGINYYKNGLLNTSKAKINQSFSDSSQPPLPQKQQKSSEKEEEEEENTESVSLISKKEQEKENE